MPGIRAFIQDLLYSAITEYELLEQVDLDIGLSIFIAKLDFIVYVFIEDELGLHCVEWFETVGDVPIRLQYWKTRLESGILQIQAFKIPPDKLKYNERRLLPKEAK